jgi:hypothetical protein
MKKAMNPTVQDKPPKEAMMHVESPTSHTREYWKDLNIMLSSCFEIPWNNG